MWQIVNPRAKFITTLSLSGLLKRKTKELAFKSTAVYKQNCEERLTPERVSFIQSDVSRKVFTIFKAVNIPTLSEDQTTRNWSLKFTVAQCRSKGAWGTRAPWRVQILSISFLGNFGKIVCWRPRGGLAPHLGELLDPPLRCTIFGIPLANNYEIKETYVYWTIVGYLPESATFHTKHKDVSCKIDKIT